MRRPAPASAGLALALAFSAAGCDRLLPDRPAVAVAPPADSAPSAPARARARKPAPPADTTGISAAEAFGQIRRGLRRLVAAEQGFYAENGAYTEDLERMGYRAEGRTAVKFLWLKRDGWAASGTHPALPGMDCVVYVGRANAAPTSLKYVRSAREGVLACDDTPPARRTANAPAPPAPAPVDTASALDLVNPVVQMRVDLRNLVHSQNAYFQTQGIYSRRTEPLALQYLWHRGVTIRVLTADGSSWAARASHARRPGKSCVVWYGAVPARPATEAQRKIPEEAGVPVCDD